MPSQISGNGGGTWWTHPQAIHDGTNLYFTATTNSMLWRVFQNSSSTFALLDTGTEQDDHNAPSILARPGKDVLAFYTRHGKSNIVNWASWDRTGSFASNWTDEGNLTFSNYVTYSQLLDFEDKIFLMCRSETGKWKYRTTLNWGTSWSSLHTFFDNSGVNIYLLFTPSETEENVWHVAGAKNPASSTEHYIIYAKINVETNKVYNFAGEIGDIYTLDGIPFSKTDFDDIEAVSGTTAKIRLLDVGDKHGKTVIYYARWGDVTSQYYQAVQETDGSWTHSALGINTGALFTTAQDQAKHYIGGVALDRNNNNILYVSREASGTWYIDKHTVNSDMTLSSATNITSHATKKLIRPYAVRGHSSMIYQECQSYTDYNDFTIHYYKEDL